MQPLVISGREIDTWKELKDILTKTFSDQRDENSLLHDLMLLRQDNESPSHFYQNWQNLQSLLFTNVKIVNENLIERTIGGNAYDDLILKAFLSGLKEPLGCHIRAQRQTTIEQALTYVLDEENINYVRNNHSNTNLRTQNLTMFNRPNYITSNNFNNSNYNNPRQINRSRQSFNNNDNFVRNSNTNNNFRYNNNFRPFTNFNRGVVQPNVNRFANNDFSNNNFTNQRPNNNFSNNNANNNFTNQKPNNTNNNRRYEPMEVDPSGLFSTGKKINHLQFEQDNAYMYFYLISVKSLTY